MRTLEQRLSYEQLELIPSRSRNAGNIFKPVILFVTQMGARLVQALVMAEEPHIWTKADEHGSLIWYVRDAQTRHVKRFDSEQDVRAWLER